MNKHTEANRESLAREFGVDWVNPPTLTEIKDDVTRGLSEVSQHHQDIDRWIELRKAPPVKAKKGRSTVTPRLVRRQNEWRYASLSEPFLSTIDLFDSLPRTYADKEAAEANKLILNYQFNYKIDKVKFIDDYVRAAVDTGTVFLKVGWKYDTATQVSEHLVTDEFGNSEVVTVEEEVILANHPTVEVCNHKAIILDPTCEGDMEKANFVAFRYSTSLKELINDGRYHNLDKLENTVTEASEFSGTGFTFTDRARKKFEVMEYWGYWDVHGNGTVEPVLIVYAGEHIIRMEANPYPDGKPPFIVVPYMPVRESAYGEPDAELIGDNQTIAGAITRGALDLLGRSANGQTGIRNGFLDPTNRKRYEEGENYIFNINNASPESAIYHHKYPEIPNSVFQFLALQNDEAESLTGVKAYHGGIGGDTLGRTATGARGALGAASQREIGILRRLVNGLVKVGYRFMSMNAEFLSDVEQVRIHKDEFVEIAKTSLYGDIDIILDISTVESDNAKAEDLAFLMQTMGNTLPPTMTQKVLAEYAKLRKMPDLAREIRDYAPEPDPVAEQIQMLQIQLLEAQILFTQAKAQEHFSGAQLKGSKVGVEEARANDIQGKADLSALNFMNEMTGNSLQRDIEKLRAEHSERTKATLDLEAGRAMLKQGQSIIDKE